MVVVLITNVIAISTDILTNGSYHYDVMFISDYGKERAIITTLLSIFILFN